MKSLPTVGIRVEGTRTAYSLKLNNVELLADRWYESAMDTAIVNHWVFPGLNNIEVNIHVPWDDSERHERNFKAEILSITKGADPVILGALHWVWTEEGALPFNARVDFNLPDDFPRWTWMDAKPIEFSNVIQSQIEQKIEILHRAFQSKDLLALEAMLKLKALDMGRAYGIPDEERLADQREFFKSLLESPDFSMKPLDIKNAFFEIEGSGRLVKVIHMKGTPLLITDESAAAGTFSLPLYFTHIYGNWEIVR